MVFVVEAEQAKLLDRVFPGSGHGSVLASRCLLPLVDVDGSVVDSFLSIWFGWFDGSMSESGRALSLSEHGLHAVCAVLESGGCQGSISNMGSATRILVHF